VRLLDKAVAQLGGSHRPGQEQMAQAVEQALEVGQHLLVQAGTGVGKTLAYLIPALAHAVATGQPVVVATATLALQRQIMDKDLPLALDAVKDQLDHQPQAALLMGRANYLCRSKLEGDYPEEDQALFEVDPLGGSRPSTGLAAQVKQLHQWAKQTTTGQRDDVAGGVNPAAWRQVSVSAVECTGAKCRFQAECFAEQAREQAAHADLVVTNHAMVALSLAGQAALPEYGAIVIDEAHQLTASLTGAYTDELSAAQVWRAGKSVGRLKADTGPLDQAATTLENALHQTATGWFRAGLPQALTQALVGLRGAVRSALTATQQAETNEAARQQAQAQLNQILAACDRLTKTERRSTSTVRLDVPPPTDNLNASAEQGADASVIWCARPGRGSVEGDPVLYVAPLSVAGQLRERLLDRATTVLTAATLAVGGSFKGPAAAAGLSTSEHGLQWRGLTVASPFDYQQQAILYLASHLPAPDREGRAGIKQQELMAQLIEASGGGALGLFSSQRAAERAAEAVAGKVDYPVLCQGERTLGALIDQFLEVPDTCLFGTLSLWQGLDAPGPTCRLVMIDRLPFPRPDDPLTQARTQAVNQAGRSGFMEVAVSHAATLLAQGVGRLIRQSSDRGVVAVLDSRLATARYGPFMLATLPPMWRTEQLDQVLASLGRLAAEGTSQRAYITGRCSEQKPMGAVNQPLANWAPVWAPETVECSW